MPLDGSHAAAAAVPQRAAVRARPWTLRRAAGWILAGAGGAALLAVLGSGAGRRVPVQAIEVARGPIEATLAAVTTGTVESDRQVDVAFQTSGVVAEVLADAGDEVRRGALLARLDDREARAALDLARADLEASRANHERAIAALKVRGTASTSGEAEARARLDRAQADLDRTERLFREGIASRQDLDRAEADARIARAAHDAARARGGDRDMAELEAAAAAAAVEQARARVEAAKVALERCALTAPFDATVAERRLEAGQVVVPLILAATPAFRLVDRKALFVRAAFDEADAALLAPGMPARVTLDAAPGRRFDGVVTEVAPVVTTARMENRSIAVEVRLAEAGGAILPGMSADVEILAGRRDSALVVPSDALMEAGGGTFLYVAEEGVARRRAVTTGVANWDLTEIVSGVAEGDLVIVSLDAPGLHDGARVRVESAARPGP
jgi:HlyD family secretion protein